MKRGRGGSRRAGSQLRRAPRWRSRGSQAQLHRETWIRITPGDVAGLPWATKTAPLASLRDGGVGPCAQPGAQRDRDRRRSSQGRRQARSSVLPRRSITRSIAGRAAAQAVAEIEQGESTPGSAGTATRAAGRPGHTSAPGLIQRDLRLGSPPLRPGRPPGRPPVRVSLYSAAGRTAAWTMANSSTATAPPAPAQREWRRPGQRARGSHRGTSTSSIRLPRRAGQKGGTAAGIGRVRRRRDGGGRQRRVEGIDRDGDQGEAARQVLAAARLGRRTDRIPVAFDLGSRPPGRRCPIERSAAADRPALVTAFQQPAPRTARRTNAALRAGRPGLR